MSEELSGERETDLLDRGSDERRIAGLPEDWIVHAGVTLAVAMAGGGISLLMLNGWLAWGWSDAAQTALGAMTMGSLAPVVLVAWLANRKPRVSAGREGS